jgi:hypothetical protein
MVKCLPPLPGFGNGPHPYSSALEIQFDDLVEGPDVDVVFLPEGVDGSGDQGVGTVDKPADVVGDPSRGIGDIRAPLESDDIQILSPSSGLGGGTQPGCIASHDDQSFPAHEIGPPVGIVCCSCLGVCTTCQPTFILKERRRDCHKPTRWKAQRRLNRQAPQPGLLFLKGSPLPPGFCPYVV